MDVHTWETNAHEAAEAIAEEQYDAKEAEFYRAIKAPVIRYKHDPAPTVEDAARITAAFERCLGKEVQVIYDEAYQYETDCDTDWALFGFDESVLSIINTLCEHVICYGSTADKAWDVVQDKISMMEAE